MKFEIDDKTGMIETDNDSFHEYWPAEAKDLEEILQAVKKTQEKLVNKQIQEIQDSKNTEYDPWAKSSFSPSSKAEQNQKIVDRVEEEIGKLTNDIDNWEPTSPSMIRSKQTTENQIKLLEKIKGKDI